MDTYCTYKCNRQRRHTLQKMIIDIHLVCKVFRHAVDLKVLSKMKKLITGNKHSSGTLKRLN